MSKRWKEFIESEKAEKMAIEQLDPILRGLKLNSLLSSLGYSGKIEQLDPILRGLKLFMSEIISLNSVGLNS